LFSGYRFKRVERGNDMPRVLSFPFSQGFALDSPVWEDKQKVEGDLRISNVKDIYLE